MPVSQNKIAVGGSDGIMTGMAKEPDMNHTDVLVCKGRRLPLAQPCLIGRAPDNDVVIDDREVSRRHAMIYKQGTNWWLSDLGSRNGLRVNGIRLNHARRLRDGDEVSIGGQTLCYISTEAEDRRTAALPGETTQISAEGRHSPLPAMFCELIVATTGGEILEGEKAARWFFGKTLERSSEKARSLLPPAVRAWLKRQNATVPTGGVALELQEVERRVIVTLCRCNAGRYFLLVREESAHAAVERLQALGLSPREAEVMHWVGDGKTNPEIASILKVTTHTVNRHLEHILAKLGVENRQKAIVTVLERLGTE